EITPAEKIDIVIVPLLAFDAAGNRVGYGKGFYDQFLKTCRKDCKKIGLSLFEASQDLISNEEHDVKLDYAITPKGVTSFLDSSQALSFK
ncbi:MAG: 5-formyltetrahydrofolate cyclo-ligase, partial [Cyclobacteriaceae bacterium]